MPSGVIYAIRNLRTGRAYIGSTVKLRTRWNAHRSRLRLGNHHARHLQRSWNKYGAGAFEFAAIETVADYSHLLERETFHIVAHRAAAGVYNHAPVAGSALGMKMPPMTLEHRRKISQGRMGIRISEDHKLAISKANKGRVLTPEHLAKLVTATTNRVHSDATRKKLSASARNISDETREKRRQSLLATITPERRATMSKSASNISDETRRKRSEAVKAAWAVRSKASRDIQLRGLLARSWCDKSSPTPPAR